MEKFTEMINALDSWLWGLPMIVLLLGTHVFMTLRTGFIQRKTFTGIRLSVTKDPDSPGDVSQFQALTTALASTIGTGNIVGVGTAAFSQIPYIGPAILVIGIITFAYSTILGWSYYGERAAEYLLGRKAILPYKVIFTAIVVLGPVLALDLVWTIADVLNALMAIPNLVAVLLLSGVIAKETRHYLANLDEKDTTEIPVVRR